MHLRHGTHAKRLPLGEFAAAVVIQGVALPGAVGIAAPRPLMQSVQIHAQGVPGADGLLRGADDEANVDLEHAVTIGARRDLEHGHIGRARVDAPALADAGIGEGSYWRWARASAWHGGQRSVAGAAFAVASRQSGACRLRVP